MAIPPPLFHFVIEKRMDCRAFRVNFRHPYYTFSLSHPSFGFIRTDFLCNALDATGIVPKSIYIGWGNLPTSLRVSMVMVGCEDRVKVCSALQACNASKKAHGVGHAGSARRPAPSNEHLSKRLDTLPYPPTHGMLKSKPIGHQDDLRP